MVVTDIKKAGKNKVNIYINNKVEFQLSFQDLKHYKIVQGQEISKDTYLSIKEEILLPMAKKKALNILKYMDRSEFELRKKLQASFFPNDIIDNVIEILFRYKYLDDERYARSYIRYRKESKSWFYIKNKLKAKGIKKDIMEKLYSQEYLEEEFDPELIAIEKEINKKTYNSDLSYEKKQKLIASLYRKGFNLEKIRRFI